MEYEKCFEKFNLYYIYAANFKENLKKFKVQINFQIAF